MDSLYFIFDGVKSSDMGVYLVNMSSGFISDPFLSEREILSEKIPGNDIPYVYGVERSPLKLKLTLSCLDDKWTFEKRREIASWLNKDYYAELISSDYIDRRYYVLYDGGIDLQTNGIQEGYIEVDFVNISPYSYSPVYSKIYNLSNITEPTIIEFYNYGDIELYPDMWIQKINNGDLSIKNLANGGKEFKFVNLADNETLYIDNQNRIIETDLPDYYRHNDFNNNYLKLVCGRNRLEVSSPCKIEFKYQFIFNG